MTNATDKPDDLLAALKAETLKPEKDFAQVLNHELQAIDASRSRDHEPGRPETSAPADDDVYGRAAAMGLTGLAFSGGGIRSATFNLGIIQALSALRKLGRFDYLSTVSGGGYIGGWLAALVYHRLTASDNCASALHADLSPLDATANAAGDGPNKAHEDAAVGFLRAYSNYLTPNVGLLSTDTLASVSAYLRNLILVQTMILSLLLSLLMVPRVIHGWWWRGADTYGALPYGWSAPGVIGGVLLLVTAWGIGRNSFAAVASPRGSQQYAWRWVIVPAVLAAFSWARAVADSTGDTHWLLWCAGGALLGTVANVIASVVRPAAAGKRVKQTFAMVGFGAAAGALAGAGMAAVEWGLARYIGLRPSLLTDWFTLAVLPFVVLQVLSIAIVFYLGLMGRLLDHHTHEWWARYGALLIAATVGVGGLFVISIYGPVLVDYLHGWLSYAGGLLWLGTSAFVLYMGASSRSGEGAATWTERAITVGPYVFIVGLAVLLSWATVEIFKCEDAPAPLASASCQTTLLECKDVANNAPCHLAEKPCLPSLLQDSAWDLAAQGRLIPTGIMIGAGLLWWLLAWRVDINLFSLHNFYRNRLTRGYLGAARVGDKVATPRAASAFTGFDPADDFALAELAKWLAVPPEAPPDAKPAISVCRPYPVLNTTLNLSAGTSLAWQQRKAASFFFTPLYCGYGLPPRPESGVSTTGFEPTHAYMRNSAEKNDLGAMLGSVVAVSGAAASPNSGFHTSPAVAFLMTLFNVRLGRWCPNTAAPQVPTRSSPALGGGLLLQELFGQANSERDFVYLSDGGHFDNLGIYELLRRRVRHIVVCDCGQDEHSRFDDLADTLRKAYTDLGVRIEINVEAIRQASEDDKVRLHKVAYVTGTIHYPALASCADAQLCLGKIVLIKPCLTERIYKNAPDIRNYALVNPAFPQQTTADQWFDEAQFESYRKLGYLLGIEVFAKLDELLGK